MKLLIIWWMCSEYHVDGILMPFYLWYHDTVKIDRATFWADSTIF